MSNICLMKYNIGNKSYIENKSQPKCKKTKTFFYNKILHCFKVSLGRQAVAYAKICHEKEFAS